MNTQELNAALEAAKQTLIEYMSKKVRIRHYAHSFIVDGYWIKETGSIDRLIDLSLQDLLALKECYDAAIERYGFEAMLDNILKEMPDLPSIIPVKEDEFVPSTWEIITSQNGKRTRRSWNELDDLDALRFLGKIINAIK